MSSVLPDWRHLLLVLAVACGAAHATPPPPAAAAAAGERRLVAEKSEIAFSVKQMGVPVTGTFRKFSARVQLDPAQPQAGSAELQVEVGSLDTGNAEADEIARSRPWLDAAGFPRATFVSTAVRAVGARFEAEGVLTIRGKARPVKVPFALVQQPDGTAVVTGELPLRRTDFGIGGGEWNESELVADEVPVKFRLTLGAPAPGLPPAKESR